MAAESLSDNVTHVSIHGSIKIISAEVFYEHPNIVELICHIGVRIIEQKAFYQCPRLKQVVMPGVEKVEKSAFGCCRDLEYVECGKLEIIKEYAFLACSFRGINLPSARIVEESALNECMELLDVNFGKNLESVGKRAFCNSEFLERITIPLKNGLFEHDDTFCWCQSFHQIHLVERDIPDETVSALQLAEWRNDMIRVINSINQVLPNTSHGDYHDDVGEKAFIIRQWIGCLLHKIIRYKALHRQLLNEAATTLQHTLPFDIVRNNILSFLELPLHKFDGER